MLRDFSRKIVENKKKKSVKEKGTYFYGRAVYLFMEASQTINIKFIGFSVIKILSILVFFQFLVWVKESACRNGGLVQHE